MSVSVYAGAEIPHEVSAWWRHLVETSPAFHSPFFRPEFTQLVASVRTDVEVGVIEQDGRILAVFPFQRGGGRLGRPVAGPLSDFQGMITPPGVSWNALDVLRSCDLSCWSFRHLIEGQMPFQAFCFRADASPYLDLEGGFSSYWQKLTQSARETIRKTWQTRRKVERELGPARVELAVRDHALLDQVITWKSQQYQRTGVRNVFAFPWTRELLHAALESRSPEFCGQLSALYFGDRLVALHMGLRSAGRLHYWFPVYHVDYARYAPGRMLLQAITERAAESGITRIDMGRGLTQFKRLAMTDVDIVYDGVVDTNRLRYSLRRRLERVKDRLRVSPLRRPLQRLWQWLRGGPDVHFYA